jgi:hypothetical protein
LETNSPIHDLAKSLLRLGELNTRIWVMMAEATIDAFVQPDPGAAPVAGKLVSPAEIDAAAKVIERGLLADYELGFQCQLRLNFPRDRIMAIAEQALEAARDAG